MINNLTIRGNPQERVQACPRSLLRRVVVVALGLRGSRAAELTGRPDVREGRGAPVVLYEAWK